MSSPLTPSEGVVLSRIFLLLRKEWNSCSTPTVVRVCVLLKGTHLLLEEGADKSGFSSSPSGTRNCATPSIGPSAGHTSALRSRRCRRKRRFIVTFRCPQLWDSVHRPFCRPYLRAPFMKVPTKAAFHRHLPAFAAVRPCPYAFRRPCFCALSTTAPNCGKSCRCGEGLSCGPYL